MAGSGLPPVASGSAAPEATLRRRRPRAVLALIAVVAAVLGQPARQARGASPVAAPAEPPAGGRRALTLVSYRWERLGYRLVFAPPRPGVRAQADLGKRVVTVFMAADDVPHRVAHDIAHEFGHAYDERFLTDAARRRYLRLRAAAGRAWWPGGQVSDYHTGAGDFAEVFARCTAASPEFRSTLAAPPPDPCRVLTELTGDATLGR